ncbi:MAG TPA: non-homologous end-joining DNA ligase [Actinomycetota bacterium]|jgi:bifunctional non-homologous end joining protein LigD|nr:non-homologous end-joining DNA ligase [Actinomycetota bacterium]
MAATEPDAIRVSLEGRDVRLTHLDRVLWPATGLTKGWLLQSYLALAPTLLPHLDGRPITMWRYPEGVDHNGWWQNECRGAPGWVHVYTYTGKDGREHRHCVIDDVASLMWLVNLGTIEIHPFPFTGTSEQARPSWLVFDLDPGEPAGLRESCKVGMVLRDVLQAQALNPVAKTSGVKGLHVFAPLDAAATFDAAKSYARTVAAALASELPDLVVDRQARTLRTGKVLLDWLQNDRFRSTVAPYSLRATDPPSISTPVTWDEVRAVGTGEAPPTSLSFGLEDVLQRVDSLGDLFASVLTNGAAVPR